MKPAPYLLRSIAGMPLGMLLFFANRTFRSTSFYGLKDAILTRWGRPDGTDLQVLPGLPCWTCAGTGKERAERDTLVRCADCFGSGEYRPEKHVALNRYRLGMFVFHQPVGVYGHRNQFSYQPKNRIYGLIRHTPSRVERKLGHRCRLLLQWVCDGPRGTKTFLRNWTQHTRAWVSDLMVRWKYGLCWLQRPRLSPWHRPADRRGYEQHDLPF